MGWAKLDDRYDDGRKIKRAWRQDARAVGLHAMAITYCARHEYDGKVDVEWIVEKIPERRQRERCLSTLLDCGLFEPLDEAHFLVHDYLDYNMSRAELEDKRRKDSERKARGGSNGSPNGFRSDSKRNPVGVQTDSESPVPSRPVPIEDPPFPPQGGRQRDQDEWGEAFKAWALALLPDADPDAALTACRAAFANARLTGHDRPTREDVLAGIRKWHPSVLEAAA